MEDIIGAILNQHIQVAVDPNAQIDMVNIDDGTYHIIQNGQSYLVTLLSMSSVDKRVVFEIDGHRYDVSLEDRLDRQIVEMGYASAAEDEAQDIIAPMPGKVLEMLVVPGAEVSAGDHILILEAMKMENVIKAHQDGTVASIDVEVGQSVQKGDIMVSFA